MKKLTFVSVRHSSSANWWALILVLFSAASLTQAQVDGTWKPFTGSGNWSDSTRWTGDPNPVPGGASSTINFTTGTGGSVFAIIDGIVASRTAGVINFAGISPWTVSATDGGTLTLDNGASNAAINIASDASRAATISAATTLASSLVITNDSETRQLGVTGTITETGTRSITKNGVGRLYLGFNAHSFSGGFTLGAGSVRADTNGSFGTGTLTLNGGSVVDTGGARFYANTLVLGGDITFASESGGSSTFSGATTLTGNRVLTVEENVSTGLGGNIGDGAGGYSITKNGAGLLTLGLSGGGGNNTYSGGFVLNAGTVQLSGPSGTNTQLGTGNVIVNGGSLSANIDTRALANNFTFNADLVIPSGSTRIDFNGTGTLTGDRVFSISNATNVYNGSIGETGGSHSLTKSGAGTLWFGSAAHTFTGGLIVDAGQLNLGGSSTLAATGDVTLNGGTLNLGAFTNSVGSVFINGGSLIGSGSLSSNEGFTATGGTINAVLAGNGTFTKNGAGTTTLGGNNTYTGDTIINDGTLALGASNRIANTSALAVNGGVFDLATFSDTVGAVTLAGGSITSSTGELTGSSYALQSGSASAILGGSAAATKTTTGTVTLTGVNTYTGATTISGGTLAVSGSGSINSTSGISASSGTLQYNSDTGLDRNVTLSGGALVYNSSANYSGTLTFTNGTVGGTNLNGNLDNLSIGAGQTLSPGNSPGTASTGDQTWAANGTYLWEINDATGTAGSDPGWDLLSGTGALTISATAINPFSINITSLTLGNVGGDAANFNGLTTNYQWMIADFGSAISFDPTAFAINLSAFTNATGGGTFAVALGSDFGIGGDNSQIWLTYTAIPEPSAVLLILVGITFVCILRRRRSSRVHSQL